MYPGFCISNILESSIDHNNILYHPHYSLFDVAMMDVGLYLHCIDHNAHNFFDKDCSIIRYSEEQLYNKSYSLYITNNPLLSIKNNITNSMHLNSIMLCHDTKILGLKKEDLFLICNNTIKPHDYLYYFPEVVSNFQCSKIESSILRYSIPNELCIENDPKERHDIGIFCYNKHLDDDYIKNISGIESTNLKTIPKNLNDTKELLNKYKLVIELDSGSIVNVLWAIACGCIGVIIDLDGSLSAYRNIPNLYIVNSMPDMINLLKQNIPYQNSAIPNNLYISQDDFKNQIISTIKQYAKKAFII